MRIVLLLLACLPGLAFAGAPLYAVVPGAGLAPGLTAGLSMDAKAADLDGDGDLDLVVAMEWAPHLMLFNDGQGRFTDDPTRAPRTTHDHEEAVLADLDGDRSIDILLVSEDDRAKELYLNDGKGRFRDASDRLRADAVTNGAIAVDLDADGDRDLVFANAGADQVWINDGRARFTDESARRLPATDDVSQDVAAGDLDGDGDLDLVFGNEDGNRLLLNDGRGGFAGAPDAAWPAAREETRKVALGDVDGDGDLDVFLANVRFFQAQTPSAQDRLLLNDGQARLSDVTAERLPKDEANAAHGDLHDLDGDGDLDILRGDVVLGAPAPRPVQALVNDGTGRFAPAADAAWPRVACNLFDSAQADFDADGAPDLYLACRQGSDVLLRARRAAASGD
ncbi:MAG: VCBS repeat-containing protein [Xanthomonadaceae bacterium]|jgi:hypothetical protein|nr:VCBS repeat-containing protein [Xanthomonadaceae bacterium]